MGWWDSRGRKTWQGCRSSRSIELDALKAIFTASTKSNLSISTLRSREEREHQSCKRQKRKVGEPMMQHSTSFDSKIPCGVGVGNCVAIRMQTGEPKAEPAIVARPLEFILLDYLSALRGRVWRAWQGPQARNRWLPATEGCRFFG
jgi:hypothetical protein